MPILKLQVYHMVNRLGYIGGSMNYTVYINGEAPKKDKEKNFCIIHEFKEICW